MKYRVAAIITQDEKVMLTRSHRNGHFSLPGGKLDDGEGELTALEREVREETDVGIVNPVFYERILYNGDRSVCAVYWAGIAGTPVPSGEIKEIVWVDRRTVGNYALSESTKTILPRLMTDGIL